MKATIGLLLAMACVSHGAEVREPTPEGFLEVQVHEVLRDPRTAQPVVILTDARGQRGMPIWIGEAEARAMESARLKITPRRPMTHDLLAGVLDQLDARPVQVRITELRDNIYYARILLDYRRKKMEVDSRPSDAMVLALRAECPIVVSATLFDSQSARLHVSSVQKYGLDVQELTEDLKSALGFRGEGILISQVEPESSASRDGLLHGDILVQADGVPISRVEDLEKTMGGAKGDLKVSVHRDGSLISMTLHP
jgi:bifunctional DNase/RNase